MLLQAALRRRMSSSIGRGRRIPRVRSVPNRRSPQPRAQPRAEAEIRDETRTLMRERAELASAMQHGAASIQEATQALRSVLAVAASPARSSARTVAEAMGETATRVASGLHEGERAFAHATGFSEWFARLLVAGLFLAVMTGSAAAWEAARDYLGVAASKAVSDVLSDDAVRHTASATASELAESLLSDASLRARAVAFVRAVTEDEQASTAAATFLATVLRDESTQRELAALLQHEETMASLRILLVWALGQPDVLRSLEETASWLAADASFQKRAVQSLLDVAHTALDDEQLRAHASEAIQAVFADSSLQRTTGDALWEAVKWSMTPSILRSKKPTSEAASESPEEPTSLEQADENDAARETTQATDAAEATGREEEVGVEEATAADTEEGPNDMDSQSPLGEEDVLKDDDDDKGGKEEEWGGVLQGTEASNSAVEERKDDAAAELVLQEAAEVGESEDTADADGGGLSNSNEDDGATHESDLRPMELAETVSGLAAGGEPSNVVQEKETDDSSPETSHSTPTSAVAAGDKPQPPPLAPFVMPATSGDLQRVTFRKPLTTLLDEEERR